MMALKVADSLMDIDLARIQFSNRLFTISILTLLSSVAALAASYSTMILSDNLTITIFASAGATAIVAVVSAIVARNVPYLETSKSSGFRTILTASVPVTTAQLLASLLLYLPVLLLTWRYDLTAVGIFSGIAYILTAADLVGSSISKIFITPFRQTFLSEGRDALVRQSSRILFLLFLIGLFISMIIVLFGTGIFVWIYGPSFAPDAFSLALFSAASIFIVLSFMQSVTLNVLNRYYGVANAYLAACIVAVIVGYFCSFQILSGLVCGALMAASGAFTRFFILSIFVHSFK